MTSLIKKPLFWTNVVAISVTGMMFAGLAFGWTNPSAAAPGGSGAITATSDGKVGIGTASPTQRLDVSGYLVARTGDCIGTDDTAVVPPASSLTASSGGTSATIVGALAAAPATAYKVSVIDSGSLVTTKTYTAPASTLSGVTTLVSGGTRPPAPAPSEIPEPFKLKGCRKTWPYGVGVADSGAAPSFDSVGIVTKNRLAKFVNDIPGKETIGDSNIVDDNKTVYVTGDFAFTGKLINGSVPYYRVTDIPKIDCGKGFVLQGINPKLCVSYAQVACVPGPLGSGCAGAPSAGSPPSAPTTCTSSVPGGTSAMTAICGLTCSTAHITAYTGAGTPFVSAIPDPPPAATTTYICNGKPTSGPSSITCSC